MPVDPNIPLQAGQNIPQFGPNPAMLLNEQATAAKLAQFNRQQQGMSALRQLYQNPQNLDPRTGQPTPDAMRMLMTQSPATGLDLRRTLMSDQLAQSQLAMARAKEGDAVLKEKFRVAEEANAVYNDALKTMTPDAARKVAQEIVVARPRRTRQVRHRQPRRARDNAARFRPEPGQPQPVGLPADDVDAGAGRQHRIQAARRGTQGCRGEAQGCRTWLGAGKGDK